ncbi:MAG: response regulator transcription factor [Betaproteobacteria bacterium]|nr:response regulator transcription factor [Betaproteobacteria bacterium]MDE2622755.1 response regulator transcription factor [Betaproteobacteria bacterium]
MVKVLLIDDDVELVEMLREYLQGEGIAATIAHDGEQGLAEVLGGGYGLVVLDVMMPHLNGLETLRRIRTKSWIPVLMLTARGDDMDRIVGLELGADDYVAKPCTPRELTARIRAILRRSQASGSDEVTRLLEAGHLKMWPTQRRAEWKGVPLELTSTEFNLLEILARHAGQAVSKKTLSELGLGRPLARFDRSIDVHMSKIRSKLGTLSDGRSHIYTDYRQGYRFIKE